MMKLNCVRARMCVCVGYVAQHKSALNAGIQHCNVTMATAATSTKLFIIRQASRDRQKMKLMILIKTNQPPPNPSPLAPQHPLKIVLIMH